MERWMSGIAIALLIAVLGIMHVDATQWLFKLVLPAQAHFPVYFFVITPGVLLPLMLGGAGMAWLCGRGAYLVLTETPWWGFPVTIPAAVVLIALGSWFFRYHYVAAILAP